jgi:hypothetical protein
MKAAVPIALRAALFVLALAAGAAAEEPKPAPPPGGQQKQPEPYTITGPFNHANLSIFLIHGAETLPGKHFLTLEEAVEAKKAIVHETRQVNQLSIENKSPDVTVFIQSGDIVQGGQQDRILAMDLLVPPQAKLPIPSFCVEQGRWTQRGAESDKVFEKSGGKVPSKDLKLAVTYRGDQRLVWRQVAQTQAKLSKNLGVGVQAGASASSLPLSLENRKLLDAAAQYEKALAKVADGTKDVIGYAYAVNGSVAGAEVFGSAALFRKLWPQLLRSNAVEAVAELKPDQKPKSAPVAAVKAFMTDADQGKQEAKDITQRMRIIIRESKKNICIETRDREGKEPVIHRSYVEK